MVVANPPGIMTSAVHLVASQVNISAASGKEAAQRALAGPMELKLAPPQCSSLSRPSSGNPSASRSAVTGNTRARSVIASNSVRARRPSMNSSALRSMSARMSLSARGAILDEMTVRSFV
jgi:hypothetical protein